MYNHNKSFMHNINPLMWLKQWNYHDTKHLRALLACVRIIVLFFSVRDKFVSGIALGRKAHYQNLKTLRKSRTDVSVLRPLLHLL